MSNNFEPLTMKMYFDATSHTLTSAFGTFQITAEAGNYARVEFDFTGQYDDPEDEALPNPTHERTLPAQVEFSQGNDYYDPLHKH